EPAPVPSGFVDDKSSTTGTVTQVEGTTVKQNISVGGLQQTNTTTVADPVVGDVQQTTTTTVVETDGGANDGMGTGENVNINMGVNGVGLNMNIGVTETGGNTSSTTSTRTTTTRTTTTTTSSGTMAVAPPVQPTKPAPVAEPYRMPGYTGPIGCAMPMSTEEFNEAKQSIDSKGFEETKMTLAKQIVGNHCLNTNQVKEVMGLFGFEETKLEFAKFAYDHTHDIGNYYKVNDAFGFESSIEELNSYLKSH
ncbi:MAG TPA: DUF4476 domain-containing protein, partial [Flavobacteriales bacterium]|nr:DUF4476 domain-containing protein [Flavobacteriales bacterium]